MGELENKMECLNKFMLLFKLQKIKYINQNSKPTVHSITVSTQNIFSNRCEKFVTDSRHSFESFVQRSSQNSYESKQQLI